MKRYSIILLLLFAEIQFSYGQDIDFYHKHKNENYEMPKIDSSMSYSEFKLLSENLRMIDMANAAIVPGYVHFKTGEKKIAYTLLSLRLISYGTIAVFAFNEDISVDWFKINYQNSGLQNKAKTYNTIYASALVLAAGTYLFDWIKGSNSLKDKQERIRYKYSIKLSLESCSSVSEQDFKFYGVPTVGFKFNF